MTKEEWKKKIIAECEEAGTYKTFFNSVIETLAGILETRDKAQQQFIDSGGEATREHTNRGGSTNVVKNPALVIVMESNSQALQYWRELGLTPSSLRKMNDEALKEKKKSTLEEVLKELV